MHNRSDPRDHSTRQQTGNLKRDFCWNLNHLACIHNHFFGKSTAGHSLMQGFSNLVP